MVTLSLLLYIYSYALTTVIHFQHGWGHSKVTMADIKTRGYYLDAWIGKSDIAI